MPRKWIRFLVAAAIACGFFGSAVTPAHGAPVIAAAGSIACDTTSAFYNGGLGIEGHCRQRATSDLLVGAGLSAGAHARRQPVPRRGADDFNAVFDDTWGRVKPIIRPSSATTNTAPPMRAATSTTSMARAIEAVPAGDRDKGYYSFDIGSWHLIALNTNCDQRRSGRGARTDARPDHRRSAGCDPTSRLTGTAARSPTGTGRASTPASAATFRRRSPFWDALYEAGADVVLSGDAASLRALRAADARGQSRPRRGASGNSSSAREASSSPAGAP